MSYRPRIPTQLESLNSNSLSEIRGDSLLSKYGQKLCKMEVGFVKTLLLLNFEDEFELFVSKN